MKSRVIENLYPLFFLLGYYLFFLSMERVLGIDSAPLMAKIFLLLAVIFLLLTGKPDSGNVVITALVVTMVFVSALFTDYIYFEWILVVFSLNQILAIFLQLSVTPSRRQMLVFLKIVAFAPIFSILAGFAYQIIGIGSLQGVDSLNNVSRLQGSTIPAFLAGISLSATFASLFYFYVIGNRKFLYLGLLNFFVLLLTAARMPILLGCVLLAITYMVVDSSRSDKKVLLGFVGVVSFGAFLATFGQSILARFQSDSSSGRDVLWEYFLGLIDDYNEFGIGLGHSITSVPAQISVLVGGGGAAHNDYLRIVVEIGFVQAILFFLLLSLAMFRIGRFVESSGKLIIFSFFVAFLLFCYTDNSIATPVYYPLILVGWYGSVLKYGMVKIRSSGNC